MVHCVINNIARICVITTACVFFALAPYALGASSNAQEAMRKTTRSLDIQTELPVSTAIEKTVPPLDFPKKSFDLTNIATLLLWASIIAIVIIIAKTAHDNLWSHSKSQNIRHQHDEETTPSATAERMDKAQEAADVLANRGNFAEAMHMLLLQSVNEMRRRLDISIASSLTSREILNRVSLSGAGKTAFSDIISRVEISYFGAHEPGQDEYVACRRSYEAFTIALGNAFDNARDNKKSLP